MSKTPREFLDFLRALWREGKALIMGGSLFAVIAIWGLTTGKSVPVNVAYGAIAVTFIWAGFLAWRKEVYGRTQALQENVTLRAALDASPQRAAIVSYQQPGRIFLDEAPWFLMQFFREHTTIQAKKLVDPYLGKWVRPLNVAIYNINEIVSGGHRISATSDDEEGIFITLRFGKDWDERISILRRNGKLTIIGQLTDVGTRELELENCEILDSRAP